MNRTSLEFGIAYTLMGRTLPILLVRLGVYLAFWQRDQEMWTSARDGLVLYGQAWKPLLKHAVLLIVLSSMFFLYSDNDTIELSR